RPCSRSSPYAARMKIMVIGAGGVGSAFAQIARRRGFFETCVIADIDEGRALTAAAHTEDARFTGAQLDASDTGQMAAFALDQGSDTVMTAADPRFVPQIFDAAFEAGATYVDMAMSLSQ